VVDPEDEPTTIKIRARGVHSLALFLNDDIVDLDEKVRVLINGHVEHDGIVDVLDTRRTSSEVMQKVGRNVDVLFDRDPSRIRLSMFFGWLKTARIVELRVRPPTPPESATVEAPRKKPKTTPRKTPKKKSAPPPPAQSPAMGGIIAASLFLLLLVVLLILLGLRRGGPASRGR